MNYHYSQIILYKLYDESIKYSDTQLHSIRKRSISFFNFFSPFSSYANEKSWKSNEKVMKKDRNFFLFLLMWNREKRLKKASHWAISPFLSPFLSYVTYASYLLTTFLQLSWTFYNLLLTVVHLSIAVFNLFLTVVHFRIAFQPFSYCCSL